MTPKQTGKLIDAAGGNKAFCLRLQLPYNPENARRVGMWRKRGLPIAVQLHQRNELARLERSAKRRGLM